MTDTPTEALCRDCGGTGYVIYPSRSGQGDERHEQCKCRTTPTPPATDEREAVARAIAPLVYATVTGNDDCREWEEMPEYVQDIYFQAADAALSALAGYRAAEIAAAHERGAAEERARLLAELRDFGPYKMSYTKQEDYSGEHREWTAYMTLPKGCNVFCEIADALSGEPTEASDDR